MTIYIFTGTSFNDCYNFLPKKNICSNYSEDKVKQIVRWQIDGIKKKNANNILIIFDDVMGLEKEMKKPIYKKLVSEYRHYKITFIFSVQYIKGFASPLFRECTTYTYIFRTLGKNSVEAIFENFMGDFDNWKEVRKFIDDNTKKKHNFLLIIIMIIKDIQFGGRLLIFQIINFLFNIY